jgi:signal transduction histidine kinase/CheY-like chemotaxis protein
MIFLASGSFADLFSFRDSVIEGVDICDFFLSGDRERVDRDMEGLEKDCSSTVSVSITGVSRDGRHLALSMSISCVTSAPPLFLAIFEDKSDTQRDLTKIEKLEHQAAIGTFTSSVAHEFNNVLSGIRGYAQLAKNDLSDRGLILKAFQIIEQESIRGAELCKNLSLYSGNKRLSLEPVVLSDLILATIDLQKQYLQSDSVTVETRIDEMAPFLADRYKLQQVILNLLINARHAIIPKGSGTIIISAEQENSDVVISISDDGTGIEPFHIPRLFDPFYSNKAETESSSGSTIRGTGLGLPVCLAIIKQHSGTIDVSSRPGAGTTFTVRLPFHIAERRSRQPSTEIIVRRREMASPSILVVDDEMPIREILYRMLISVASDVALAANATECEQLVSDRSFDIIFLDYVLPEMNADRLLPIIRKVSPSTKIVLISGWNGSPGKKASLKQKVEAWIDKPFNVDAIIKTVEDLSYDRSFSPKT